MVLELLRFWPRTNSAKELILLNELHGILEHADSQQFNKLIPPLFQHLARCISSTNFQVRQIAAVLLELTLQVAELTISFFNPENAEFFHHAEENIKEILPILFPPLFQTSRSHWSPYCLLLSSY